MTVLLVVWHMAGTVHMYEQSEKTRMVRYNTLVRDGDSTACKAGRNAKPFGPEICREECIGHLQESLAGAKEVIEQYERVFNS